MRKKYQYHRLNISLNDNEFKIVKQKLCETQRGVKDFLLEALRNSHIGTRDYKRLCQRLDNLRPGIIAKILLLTAHIKPRLSPEENRILAELTELPGKFKKIADEIHEDKELARIDYDAFLKMFKRLYESINK